MVQEGLKVYYHNHYNTDNDIMIEQNNKNVI